MLTMVMVLLILMMIVIIVMLMKWSVICFRSDLAKSPAVAFHCLPVKSPPSNKYQVRKLISDQRKLCNDHHDMETTTDQTNFVVIINHYNLPKMQILIIKRHSERPSCSTDQRNIVAYAKHKSWKYFKNSNLKLHGGLHQGGLGDIRPMLFYARVSWAQTFFGRSVNWLACFLESWRCAFIECFLLAHRATAHLGGAWGWWKIRIEDPREELVCSARHIYRYLNICTAYIYRYLDSPIKRSHPNRVLSCWVVVNYNYIFANDFLTWWRWCTKTAAKGKRWGNSSPIFSESF